jgi:hypothetical protein
MAVISVLEWVPVESRVFTAAAYRDDARQLYLRFRDGDIYRYFKCSVSLYREFLATGSKGEYFSHNIRNQFRHELIHRHQGCETATESLEQQLNNSVLLARARVVQKRDAAHAAGVQE